MRYYSDSEVDFLIDEIIEAAMEAIDQAAGEAARAAVLSMVEREAVLLRENQRLQNESEAIRKTVFRNTVITGLLCFASGLIAGLIFK